MQALKASAAGWLLRQGGRSSHHGRTGRLQDPHTDLHSQQLHPPHQRLPAPPAPPPLPPDLASTDAICTCIGGILIAAIPPLPLHPQMRSTPHALCPPTALASADAIYTYSGGILIAANPHKRLKRLYGPRMMGQYK